jgi:hypothetical protein
MSERHAEPNRPTVGELRINLAPRPFCFGIGSLKKGFFTMANTEELKNEMSATRTVTKLFDTSQEEQTTPSDDEPLSRTDRFFITSMLADEYPAPVSLSENTMIGGSTLSSIMELGRCELWNDLKLNEPIGSMHVMSLLNFQSIMWDCFKEAQKKKNDLHSRDFELKHALKATDNSIQLYDRHWAKQNSVPAGERVLLPLTTNTLVHGLTLPNKPNTPVDGVRLRELMEWCRVDLYLTLKPQNPFESILADFIVRTHKAGWDCFEQADWKRHKSDVRAMNVKYNLKAIDSVDRLSARLEDYRTKQSERLLHHSITGRQKLGEVASSRFDHHCKNQAKTRIHLNGNGKHP